MVLLKAERLRQGLTQMELAHRAGLTQGDLCRIERGWSRPYPGQARRLAAALGCAPNDLLMEVAPVEFSGAKECAG